MGDEITEQQVREALRRIWRTADAATEVSVETAVSMYGSASAEIAAERARQDWVLAVTWAEQELSRRDAERAEREKPITAEWFRKHGNDICSIFVCRDDVVYEIEWAAGTPGIGVDLTVYSGPRKCFCHSVNLRHITTHGQLLDLLAALKGGAP